VIWYSLDSSGGSGGGGCGGGASRLAVAEATTQFNKSKMAKK
jgi:hypothetical protein